MENKKNILPELFLTSLKIGLFTFGGGYAMIPLIQKETVEKHHWISNDDILDIVAIAESTPGPIAINSATFVGYKIAGFAGALISTVAMILPSFVIILSISYVLREFENNIYVQYAFNGIRACVLALILKALLTMYRQVPKQVFFCLLMAYALIATAFLKLNVLIVIISCALAGLIFSIVTERSAS